MEFKRSSTGGMRSYAWLKPLCDRNITCGHLIGSNVFIVALNAAQRKYDSLFDGRAQESKCLRLFMPFSPTALSSERFSTLEQAKYEDVGLGER